MNKPLKVKLENKVYTYYKGFWTYNNLTISTILQQQLMEHVITNKLLEQDEDIKKE